MEKLALEVRCVLSAQELLAKIKHDQYVSMREQLERSKSDFEKAIEKYRKQVKEQSYEN